MGQLLRFYSENQCGKARENNLSVRFDIYSCQLCHAHTSLPSLPPAQEASIPWLPTCKSYVVKSSMSIWYIQNKVPIVYVSMATWYTQ